MKFDGNSRNDCGPKEEYAVSDAVCLRHVYEARLCEVWMMLDLKGGRRIFVVGEHIVK
jgi:hypothetical protein